MDDRLTRALARLREAALDMFHVHDVPSGRQTDRGMAVYLETAERILRDALAPEESAPAPADAPPAGDERERRLRTTAPIAVGRHAAMLRDAVALLDAARAERGAQAERIKELEQLYDYGIAKEEAQYKDLEAAHDREDALEAECARLRESQGRLLEAAKDARFVIDDGNAGDADMQCATRILDSAIAAAESAPAGKEGTP